MIDIGLIQSDIVWEDVDTNLDALSGMLENLGSTADLILLPELFTTGFTMRSREFAEPMEGKTMAWMAGHAGRLNCPVAGSIIVTEGGRYYNRLIWMEPGGRYHLYDKRHLYRMSGENEHYSRGNGRLIVEAKGFRFRPLICYDLRFPVWSRNRQDYDVLVYIANWPEPRKDVWRTLLKARAIENQSYVMGLNRVGKDGMGIAYRGDSLVFDAKGNELVTLPLNKPFSEMVRLSREELLRFRERFPAWKDADSFCMDDQQDPP